MSDQITPERVLASYQDVIDLWPSRAHLGRLLAQQRNPKAPPYSLAPPDVRTWHRRDVIPVDWFESVVKLAHKSGFPEVTYRLLCELRRARKANRTSG